MTVNPEFLHWCIMHLLNLLCKLVSVISIYGLSFIFRDILECLSLLSWGSYGVSLIRGSEGSAVWQGVTSQVYLSLPGTGLIRFFLHVQTCFVNGQLEHVAPVLPMNIGAMWFSCTKFVVTSQFYLKCTYKKHLQIGIIMCIKDKMFLFIFRWGDSHSLHLLEHEIRG